MKKWIPFLFICVLTNSFPQTNISPQFSELKGMENQQGNTHLFYRIYSFQFGGYIGDYYKNSIYHFDSGTSSDSLFLFEGGRILEGVNRITDLAFWNNNPNTFIYLGEGIAVDPVAYIKRYDHPDPTFSQLGQAFGLDLGKQNDSLVIASAPYLIKSTDGGFSWSVFLDSLGYMNIVSISPFSDDEIFFSVGLDLFKTTDGGQNISTVDSHHLGGQFYYDKDLIHIYSAGYNTLVVSNNKGNAFSWSNRYSSSNQIFVSPDYSQSGSIYLADGKYIYHSTNYGTNFSLYNTLVRKIVGIYKKPNTDILYAATKYKIYEISSDTIQTTKSLPIPDEVLNYYPLAIGNRWIYENVNYLLVKTGWIITRSYVTREVVGDTIMPNGKKYYWLKDYFLNSVYSDFFERIDSVEGRVYRYQENFGLPYNEYLIDDLLAEIGDTVWSSRQWYQEYYPTTVIEIDEFNNWGLTKSRKHYRILDWLYEYNYTLTRDIGLDSVQYFAEWFIDSLNLKGCIINGVVYGDTTVVSVEDEEPEVASSFMLEQNYPNPFNPSTIIRYEIPGQARNDNMLVVLKVYDVLGNEIAILVNEEKPTGNYEIEFDGSGLPSGIYFYRLTAGSYSATKKMILIK